MKYILPIIVLFFCLSAFFSCDSKKECPDAEREARQLFKQAQQAYAAGNPDSALRCFSEVGLRFATSPDRTLRNLSGEAYNTCGVILFLQGNYPESVNSFLTAEQVGDDTIKVRVYNNIASIFHYFNDNDKALEYLERAAQGALTTKDWDVLRSATLNILNYCFEVNETGKAVSTMERLLASPLPDDDWSRYLIQTGLGMRAATKDSIPEAKTYFNNAVEISTHLPQADRYKMMSYNHLARTLMLDGRYTDAIACLDTVADLCGGEKQADTFMALCQLKADCYKALNNHKAEYETRLKYISIKDSLFSAREFGKILDLQSSQKIDRVEKNLVQEKELRINRERMVWALVVLVVLISAIVVWIWLQNKRLREALKALYEKTKNSTTSEKTDDLPPTEITSSQEEGPIEPAVAPHSKIIIDDESARVLAEAIIKVMETKPYYDPSFSIKDLSDLTSSNTKYVSYVLNSVIGKTFPAFVNSYRVEEACTRLRAEANERAFTIESIANDVGFNSRANFNAIFKRLTGLTPREYILMARADKDTVS